MLEDDRKKYADPKGTVKDKDVELTKSEKANDELSKDLPLTAYILRQSKPEQSEFVKSLIGVAGITVGSVESIPVFVKRLYETGSINKPEVKKVIEKEMERDKKNMGGLLEDERVGYADGPNEEEVERMDIRSHLSKPELLGPERTSHLENAPKDSPEFKKSRDYAVVELNMSPDALEVEINKLRNEERNQKLTGGQATIAKAAPPFNEITSDDFTELRKQKQDGGDIDGQMSMLMMTKKPEEDMLPDDEMEDEYLDFILDEALDSEEEDYLMSQLQGNERLSEIFDKVIDIAQEFAGSGPVEGPGSGVSDSIPARLSDGEFVFTAKAVDEIGADKLMAMMKDAEMKADDRQGLANGGEPEERVELPVEEQKEPQVRIVKETVDSSKGLEDEDEISKGIKSKMMLDPDQRHVRS